MAHGPSRSSNSLNVQQRPSRGSAGAVLCLSAPGGRSYARIQLLAEGARRDVSGVPKGVKRVVVKVPRVRTTVKRASVAGVGKVVKVPRVRTTVKTASVAGVGKVVKVPR